MTFKDLCNKEIIMNKNPFLSSDYKPNENTKKEVEKLHANGNSLDNIHLKHTDMENAKLVHASMSNADLTRSNFSNASMYGANLKGANLFKTILGSGGDQYRVLKKQSGSKVVVQDLRSLTKPNSVKIRNIQKISANDERSKYVWHLVFEFDNGIKINARNSISMFF